MPFLEITYSVDKGFCNKRRYLNKQRKMAFFKINHGTFIIKFYKDEAMPLIKKNNISQMTTTTATTGPYNSQEISHNQIVKGLPYVLDSLVNFNFEVLNRCWAVGEDLVLHVGLKQELARCQITKSSWIIVITYSSKRSMASLTVCLVLLKLYFV